MAYLLVTIAAIVLVIVLVRCSQHALEARVGFSPQPCITDEEYCRLMPDVSNEVALKVRAILSDATGWDCEEIHPKTRLVEFELW